MRVRLAGYKNMYCPTSVIIDHGAHSKYTNLESVNLELKKSQILFIKKWDAYVGSTNPISHKNNKYKILIVLAVDTKELKQGIRTVVDQLSKQHTVAFVICNDLTAKMDVDVMNHMLVDGVGTLPSRYFVNFGRQRHLSTDAQETKKDVEPYDYALVASQYG